MSKNKQRIVFGLLLIILSVVGYAIHFFIFRDMHHIFIYLVGDIAFVFIEVLLVTLIIHQLLSDREKRNILQKLNMIIGAFFTRMGNDLLKNIISFDTNKNEFSKHLVIEKNVTSKDFLNIRKMIVTHKYKTEIAAGDIIGLKNQLQINSDFILRLLENQTLLEHDRFTDLLWAISHLSEELSQRSNLQNIKERDSEHLAGDIMRAYRLLTREWLSYMEHLKKQYPYLFSLAIRTNPFDPDASVEIE